MKWLIRPLGALLTIAMVALLGLLILANNIDADQYREEIETAVKKLSGYTVDMRGPLSLELLPVFRFSAKDVRLADPTGLSENLAVVEKVSASIRLFPLLERKLQIGSVRLHHLKLHLISDQNGLGNWQRIPTEISEQKNRSEKSDDPMPLDFKIDSLELTHADLVWDDRQNQRYFQLSQLQLETGALLADAIVKFRLSGNAYAKHVQENSRLGFTMDGRASFDGAFEQIDLQDLAVQARYIDEKRVYQPIEINGHARLQLDQGQAQITLGKAKISELEVSGDLQIHDLHRSPTARGRLSSNTFDPRALAAALQIEMPSFSKDQAFRTLQIQGRWQLKDQFIELEEAALQIDDSRVKARGRMALLANRDTVLYAELDRIKLDSYWQPAQEEASRSPSATKGQGKHGTHANKPPLKWNGRNASLQLKIGQLSWHKIRATKINGTINLNQQGFDARLDSANIFDGAMQARVQRKTQKNKNQWRFELHGKDLAAEQVIAAAGKEDGFLRGPATVNFEGTAIGNNGAELLKSLDGQTQLSLGRAELSNARWMRAAANVLAFLKIGSQTDRDKNLLSIQSAAASLRLVDGVADNRDLDLRMPLWTADGMGTIDFVRRQVDYTLRLRIKNEENPILVPILIRGPFERLSYTPQFDKTITERAGEKIKEKIKQGHEKIEKKIKPGLDGLKEKINDKLKDLLKF